MDDTLYYNTTYDEEASALNHSMEEGIVGKKARITTNEELVTWIVAYDAWKGARYAASSTCSLCDESFSDWTKHLEHAETEHQEWRLIEWHFVV